MAIQLCRLIIERKNKMGDEKRAVEQINELNINKNNEMIALSAPHWN